MKMQLRKRKRNMVPSVSALSTTCSHISRAKSVKKWAVKTAVPTLGAKDLGQKVPVLSAAEESIKHATSGFKVLLQYSNLVPGRLIRRYKRFLADVVLRDEATKDDSTVGDREQGIVTVYCPNTGPMVGLLNEVPNARVQLSKSNDPKRKYAYTLEMIQIHNGEKDVWVGVHSTLANRMVEQALAARWLPELGEYDEVRREVKFAKNSRVDFVLTTYAKDGTVAFEKYVEVKSVTLALKSTEDGLSRCAMFPDTVSTRAQKHVAELIELLQNPPTTTASKKKVSGAIIFLVQRDDCNEFAPSIQYDEKFASLCTLAARKGVQLLSYSCTLTPDEFNLSGSVRLLGPLRLQT